MHDAIGAYHDILASGDVGAATHEALDAQLRRRDLVFGDRPLSTVLRPRFIAPDELRTLRRRLRPLMRAFGKAHERAIVDASFRAQFGMLDWEESLLDADPGFRTASPTSRLDLFYIPETGEMGLTEYNGETPAGAAFSDALSDAFLDLPAMRIFARDWEVSPIPARHGVTGALLDAWREFSGTRQAPRIAILDWLDVPTRREFELFQEHFRSIGIECVIEDPRQCELRNGKLMVAGKPADLIYKRVLISELIAQCGIESDVVRAVRERAVCMVNPFRCKILHKKASLAVLSDESNASLFDAEELEAIHRCIPWTRVVRERRSTYDGKSIDLVPYVLEHREQLVLKPNDEYGGTGIVLGWTVDDSTWRDAVRHALSEPYIVQQKVRIPKEPYPSWENGGLSVYDRMLDTAPFVTNGDYIEGFLSRLSTADLLNVTAGGGSTVPTYVVERR